MSAAAIHVEFVSETNVLFSGVDQVNQSTGGTLADCSFQRQPKVTLCPQDRATLAGLCSACRPIHSEP